MHTRRFVWNEVAAWLEDRQWGESVCNFFFVVVVERNHVYSIGIFLLKVNTVKHTDRRGGHYSNCLLCRCTVLGCMPPNKTSTSSHHPEFFDFLQRNSLAKAYPWASKANQWFTLHLRYSFNMFSYPCLDKEVSVKKNKGSHRLVVVKIQFSQHPQWRRAG